MASTAEVIPLEEKRARVSDKKRQRAKDLLQELLNLEAKYGEFAPHLESAIKALRRESERTRKSDRDLVLFAIEHGAHVIEDICDDTGLSRWDAQQVLDWMVSVNLVVKAPEYRPPGSSNKPRILYTFK